MLGFSTSQRQQSDERPFDDDDLTNTSAILHSQPPQPWPSLKSPCALASSSATLCWAASRWSCEFFFAFQRTTTTSTNAGFFHQCSDVLHPNRANVSKDELRGKLSELYKASKDQVSVFGFRTQYGGGKSTGFALIYDSPEAMKKFEPHYRLVRVGMASKIEKASRQQRTYTRPDTSGTEEGEHNTIIVNIIDTRTQGLEKKKQRLTWCTNRQAKEEQAEGVQRYGQGQGRWQGQEEINDSLCSLWRWLVVGMRMLLSFGEAQKKNQSFCNFVYTLHDTKCFWRNHGWDDLAFHTGF